MERSKLILSVIGTVALEHPRMQRFELRELWNALERNLPTIEELESIRLLGRTDVEKWMGEYIFDVRTYTIVAKTINREIKYYGKRKAKSEVSSN